ncbi:MAG: gliding motility-associated C-terminal domain-containing protein [Bacteroidales bacterium]
MNKLLHIAVLIVTGIFLAGSISQAQENPYDLPMACVGSVEEYWVKGFNGISDFDWQITDPDGNPLDENLYTIINRGDSVLVSWDESLPGGIYTFKVTEHTDYGCTGDPWEQNIVLNSPQINFPWDGAPESVAVCFGDEAELDPGDYEQYLWQDDYTGQIYYTGEAGTYQVQLIDSDYSCSYQDFDVTIHDLPEVDLGSDTVLFGAQTLTLDVSDPDIQFYDWSTGETSPWIEVEGGFGQQHISVTVTDINQCEASDTIFIDAADYSSLRIPKAFTPNGDGANDTWVFPAPSEEGSHLYPYLDDVDVRVFNRWGNLVWQSSGMFQEWDGRDLGGRPLPMDSYHYIIRLNVDGKVFVYKGSVTIVR